MKNKKHRYRLYSEGEAIKVLYVDGFRVGTGYTLPQARKIAIDHYEKERT